MPQTMTAEATSKLAQSAQNFLKALKSGVNAGVAGDLFANLLAQTKSEPEALPEPERKVADDAPKTKAQKDEQQAAPVSDEAAEDEQKIRDLLRRVREEIAALLETKKTAQTTQSVTQANPQQTVSETEIVVADTTATTTGQNQADLDAAAKIAALLAQLAGTATNAETTEQPQAKLTTTDPAAADTDKLLSLLGHIEKRLDYVLQQGTSGKSAALDKAAALEAARQAMAALATAAPEETSQKPVVTADAQAKLPVDGLPKADKKETLPEFFAANAASGQLAIQQNYFEQKQARDTKIAQLKEGEAAPQVTADNRVATPIAANNNVITAAAQLTQPFGNGQNAADMAGRQHQSGSSNTMSLTPVAGESLRGANSSYDFAGQLSATRATKGGAAGLPQVIEQVTLQIHKLAKNGVDQMTIQLRPAELGKVEIKLQFGEDNKVQGQVIVDNPATYDLLSKDSRGIERALQEAGLRTDPGGLQFSLRDGGQSGAMLGQEQNRSSSGNAANGFFANDEAGDVLEADFAVESYYVTPGRVNIKV